jgi:N-acetylglucosaminyldiphosphoundecaprenol N-acetyl-beta-D-mannosaminyltransferase
MSAAVFSLDWFRGTRADVEELLRHASESSSAQSIATVTAEMLVAARANPSVMQALTRANYRIADSVAIPLMHRIFLRKPPVHYPGVDMVNFLIQHPSMEGKVLAVVGSDAETVAACNRDLLRKNIHNTLVYVNTPSIEREGSGWRGDSEIMNTLFTLKPHIVFVALGGEGNDRQEAWVVEHAPHLPSSVGLIIGIGGALDMLGGTYRRAPLLLRRMGLEWLWRLLKQPSRWRRIRRAVITFPFQTIFDTLRAYL